VSDLAVSFCFPLDSGDLCLSTVPVVVRSSSYLIDLFSASVRVSHVADISSTVEDWSAAFVRPLLSL
jgi:hypothetical protein